jgi:hypothetical protein
VLRRLGESYDDIQRLLLTPLKKVIPNEITPMAWNMPNPLGRSRTFVPRYSSGTFGPSLTTVKTMMTILTNARADALASLVISRYKERGYDTRTVQRMITT